MKFSTALFTFIITLSSLSYISTFVCNEAESRALVAQNEQTRWMKFARRVPGRHCIALQTAEGIVGAISVTAGALSCCGALPVVAIVGGSALVTYAGIAAAAGITTRES